jgi:hypothetical protein
MLKLKGLHNMIKGCNLTPRVLGESLRGEHPYNLPYKWLSAEMTARFPFISPLESLFLELNF